MNFAEFQNHARLYVLGALEMTEMQEVEEATKKFGPKAEQFIRECYALHKAFMLTLRPAKSSALLKERLMSLVRERQRR
jgi:hypothetical protein